MRKGTGKIIGGTILLITSLRMLSIPEKEKEAAFFWIFIAAAFVLTGYRQRKNPQPVTEDVQLDNTVVQTVNTSKEVTTHSPQPAKKVTVDQLSDSMFGDVIPGRPDNRPANNESSPRLRQETIAKSTPPKLAAQPQPASRKLFTAKSFYDPDITYDIDVDRLTCSCPDFKEVRTRYNPNDPRRLCKHLVMVLVKADEIPPSLMPYRAEMEYCESCQKGFHNRNTKHETMINSNPLVIFNPDESEIDREYGDYWVLVFFKNEKHAYNPLKDCWTYTARELPELEEITCWICDRIGIEIPQHTPPGSIITTSTRQDGKNVVVEGVARGINVQLKINPSPRASNLSFTVNGEYNGSLNIKTGEYQANERLMRAKNALLGWVVSEHARVVTEARRQASLQ